MALDSQVSGARPVLDLASAIAAWWSGLSLTAQFAIATTCNLVIGMLLIGNWVTERISDGVVHTHAAAVALYTDSVIEPLVQELASEASLRPASQEALRALLKPRVTDPALVGFRIWKDDTIVFSDRAELIGKSLPPSVRRTRGMAGSVAAEYGHPEPEHLPPEVQGQPILEIYAPVRETGSRRIIALAETYQLAPTLREDLSRARLDSVLLVGGIAFCMLMGQLAIVNRGSGTIESQRVALRQRIDELSSLLSENRALRRRSTEAQHRLAEMSEAQLRRLGADLHDGPVQALGAAVLRLDVLSDVVAAADKPVADEALEDIADISFALRAALGEVRAISAGLAAPEIEQQSLAASLENAARRHERLTGTVVMRSFEKLPADVSSALKSCLYRFVQEGLSNAFRHAGGKGQAISARSDGAFLTVQVDDDGPGLRSGPSTGGDVGQGLIGLRDRVESLGGEFTAGSRTGGGGTRLMARFELSQPVAAGR
ncbi:MAG: histidine kinase [Hyphomicrobiaceae bacterium]|nr:histidine kinase [Hyphomicrobiaceae bacterium]